MPVATLNAAEETLTRAELAARLKISINTLDRAVKKGEIPGYRTIRVNRSVRFVPTREA